MWQRRDQSPHIADSNLSPQIAAEYFPPHCRLIVTQRAAGEAFWGTLKEQVKPSALRLPAAKAALVTVMQMTKIKAVAISISSLMACLFRLFVRTASFHQKNTVNRRKEGPVVA